jgi:hypothetical protein
MAFVVPPTRVGARGNRPAAAGVVAIALAIVAFAWATSDLKAPAQLTAIDTARPSPTAVAIGVQRGWTTEELQDRVRVLPAARPIPGRLTCRELSASDCRRVVRAAFGILAPGEPPVVAASVARGLICRDSIDCPAYRLRFADPLGSVVLVFGDRASAAWVNVVVKAPDPTIITDDTPLDAWFVNHV